jgi:hypothetical protein
MTERKYGIEARLCKERYPQCSSCPIEKKLDCQWDQDLNYDNQFNSSMAGKSLANYESYRKFGGRQ